jgi:hypothetical protein
MYEKPQYLTPDGYRRAATNPFKSAGAGNNARPFLPAVKSGTGKPGMPKKGIQISEETAKAIAMAIKGMLRQ